MRFPLIPAAIAALAALWTLHPAAGAGDDLRGDKKDEAAMKILAAAGLGDEFRSTAEKLAPFLNLDIYRALAPRQRTLLLRYARNRIEGADPLARCWAPDTDEEILIAYHAVEEAARVKDSAPRKAGGEPPPQPARQFFRRWSNTATDGSGQGLQGRPITLTWSIVPDGTPIPSDPSIGDSNDPSDLRARMTEIYGQRPGPLLNQPWVQAFQAAFNNISAQTGIRYVYEPNDDGRPLGITNPGRRGIRGDIRIGGHDIDGNASTLAYNFFPNNGDMVIDTNDNWFTNTNNNSIRLRNAMEHEHGHGLGHLP